MTQAGNTRQAFKPKRPQTKRRARQHSQVVRGLRVILPVFALGLVFMLVITATPRTVDHTFQQQFSHLDTVSTDIRMDLPRFTGEDDGGRAFQVIAGAATQDPRAPKLIALENPEALKAVSTPDQSLVSAKTGLYRVEEKEIDLASDVELEQGFGESVYILRTEEATVALDNQTVTTKTAVYGENNRGTIRADRMTAYREEGRTVFEDNVRMVLQPAQVPGAETEETEESGEPET